MGKEEKKKNRKLDSLLLSSGSLNLHHNQNTFSMWENPYPGVCLLFTLLRTQPHSSHILQTSFLWSLQTSSYLCYLLCCASFRFSLHMHASFIPQWYVEPFLAPPSLSWVQCCLQCSSHLLLTVRASYWTWLGSFCYFIAPASKLAGQC